MKKVTFIKFIKVLLFLLAAFGVYTFLNTLDALYPEELVSFSIGEFVSIIFMGLGAGMIIAYIDNYFKNKNNKNNEDKHNKNNDVCTI